MLAGGRMLAGLRKCIWIVFVAVVVAVVAVVESIVERLGAVVAVVAVVAVEVDGRTSAKDGRYDE